MSNVSLDAFLLYVSVFVSIIVFILTVKCLLSCWQFPYKLMWLSNHTSELDDLIVKNEEQVAIYCLTTSVEKAMYSTEIPAEVISPTLLKKYHVTSDCVDFITFLRCSGFDEKTRKRIIGTFVTNLYERMQES